MRKLVALFLALSLSGCACFGEAAQQTKGCIVLRQVLDCSKDTGIDAVMHIVPVLVSLISGGQMDFDAVLAALTAGGFKDATCIIAALESDFTAKQQNLKASGADNHYEVNFILKARAWQKAELPGVKFILPSK